jgi:hypothetical protein
MNEIIEITLSQLVLWYDGTRIQTWPTMLAKIDPRVILSSATEFGREHVTDRMTDDRHAAAEKVTRNLPGLERKGSRLVLRGIGLLDRVDGGYRLSEEGRELAELYRDEPQGTRWVRLLGRLLLTREPRTRTLIKLLSGDESRLCFKGPEWWSGSLRNAVVHVSEGVHIAPFANTDSPLPSLRSAINESPWWALGEWRSQPFLGDANDCRFVGQMNTAYSLHDISLALRASCEVFVHLGVLRCQDGECWLDHDSATAQFGEELALEFGWRAITNTKPLWQTIQELLPSLRADTGFIVVSELRDKLRQHGVENPDREIARLEAEGRLIIEATDFGQGRHGVGLHEDPSKQLIKLRVG